MTVLGAAPVISKVDQEIYDALAKAPSEMTKSPKKEEKSFFEEAKDWTTEAVFGESRMERIRANLPEGSIKGELPFGEVLSSSGPFDPKDQAIEWLRKNGHKYEIRIDPKEKAIMGRLKDDTSKTWKMRNLPGISANDFAELGGELPAALGAYVGLETIGKLGGKKSKLGARALKAALSLLAGGGAGTVARHSASDRFGQLDHLSEEEKAHKRWADPAMGGAQEVVGGTFARGAGGALKTLRAAITGKWIPQRFVERGLSLPENVSPIVEELNKALRIGAAQGETPIQFKPDSARLLNDPEFMAAVHDVATKEGMEGYTKVRELYQNNVKALDTFLDRLNKSVDPRTGKVLDPELTPQYEASKGLQDRLASEFKEEASAQSAKTVAASEVAEIAEAKIAAQAGDPGYRQGEHVRGVFQEMHEKEADRFYKAYDDLEKEITSAGTNPKGPRFFARNSQLSAKAYLEKTKGQPLEGTSYAGKDPADMKRMYDNLTILGKEGQEIGVKTFTYRQMVDHLKLVRKNLRAAYRAQGTGGKEDVILMQELEESAVKDLHQRLSSMPEGMAERFVKLNEDYATFKQKWAQDAFQDFIGFKPNGSPKVSNEELFKKFFGLNDSKASGNARSVMETIEEGGQLDTLQAIKGSIFNEYLAKLNKGTPKAAREWLSARESSAKTFLTPEEFKMLRAAENSKELAATLAKKEKAWLAAINSSSMEQSFRTGRASNIFKEIWRDGESVIEAKAKFATKFPQEWDMIKKAALRDIKESFSAHDELLPGAPVFSYDAMLKQMNKPEFVSKVRKMFGNEYVGNLHKLLEAGEILGRNPGQVTVTNNRLASALRDSFFGPLDHRSFFIKRMHRWAVRKQNQDFASMVLDPEALNQAAKRIATKEGMKRFQMLAGGGLASDYIQGSADDISKKDLILHLQSSKGLNIKNWDAELLSKVRKIMED